MEIGSLADWLSAISSTSTLCLAAYLGRTTFKQQQTSSDISLAVDLFSHINRYWDRITDDKGGAGYIYNMGQVLTHFELAALLFNTKSLSSCALPVLKDHTVEVFTSFQTSEDGESLIKVCQSSPDTFKELRAFASLYMPCAAAVLQTCIPDELTSAKSDLLPDYPTEHSLSDHPALSL